jgi:hypothetical protein
MHILVDVIATGIAAVSMMGIARQRQMLIERHLQISNLSADREVIETDRKRLYTRNSEQAKTIDELNVLVEHLDRECDDLSAKVIKWVPARGDRGKFARKSH